MSHERAAAFIQHVTNDAALRNRVEALNGNLNSLIALATESGYDFSAEDWNSVASAATSGQLNESDLDSVSGGLIIVVTPQPQTQWVSSFHFSVNGGGTLINGGTL